MLENFKKHLRKQMTVAEHRLWHYLRNRKFYGFKFRRQQVLQNYIVDFICFERSLIIELDGGQHSEQVAYDLVRTENLKKDGFRIIRFWNSDILKKTETVLSLIYDALMENHCHDDYPSSALRAPSPTRGEGEESSDCA